MREKGYKDIGVLRFGIAFLFSLCILAVSMGGTSTYAGAIAADKPIVKELHPELNKIKLSWNAIGGASGYNVYLSTDMGVTYNKVAAVPDTSFVHTSLTRDKVYYYKVVPYEKSATGIIEGTSSDVIIAGANYRGIDVSMWQGKIDWQKVKDAGIKFAMIRVAGHKDNTYYEDPYFVANVTGARSVGIDVGIYFYSVASTKEEAIAEANYTLEKINPYRSMITYPVAFDIESDYQKVLTASENKELISGYCDTIKASGYSTMVYSYLSFINSYITYDNIANYDLWFARINSVPNYPHPIRMWQYSHEGSVAGINSYVDLNYLFDPYETANGLLNLNASDGTLRYKVNTGDTFSAIASKFHLTDADLLKLNATITDPSLIKAGDSIIVDGYSLVTPTVPTIKGTAYNKLKLSWLGVTGADGYEIYRSDTKDGSYTKVGTTTATSYTNTGVDTGKTYYYKIKAYRDEVTSIKMSGFSSVVSQKTILSPATNVKISGAGYNKLKLTWSKVSGATAYKIYRATSKSGSYKKIAETSELTYSNADLSFNKTYYYKIKAVRKTSTVNVTSAYSSRVDKKTNLSKAKNLTVSKVSYNKLKITWNKVSGAKGYYVYRSTSEKGTYKKVATVKGTSYTNSKLKTGTKYYYKIAAYRKSGSKNITGYMTSAVSKKLTLSKPKATTTAGSKKITIKWSKISGTSGYEIYRATSKTGEYKLIKTVKSNTTSYKNIKLKAKKTYYYKVRAYRTVNGKKVYSSKSAITSVKTK